jgi:hypothetical protein
MAPLQAAQKLACGDGGRRYLMFALYQQKVTLGFSSRVDCKEFICLVHADRDPQKLFLSFLGGAFTCLVLSYTRHWLGECSALGGGAVPPRRALASPRVGARITRVRFSTKSNYLSHIRSSHIRLQSSVGHCQTGVASESLSTAALATAKNTPPLVLCNKRKPGSSCQLVPACRQE